MRPVLILRPEPGASATAARARQLGLEPVLAPLFAVEPVAWKVPEPAGFDALLLTSANAVRHGGRGLAALAGLPVHAVGGATAEAAKGAGFKVASTGSGDVADLLSSLPPSLNLLHLAGEDRREPEGARQRIVAVTVYRSALLPPPDALAEVANAVALVHSPRAGRRLAELVDRRESLSIVAISPAAAEACGAGWRTVAIAEKPSDELLLSLAAQLCKGSAQQ